MIGATAYFSVFSKSINYTNNPGILLNYKIINYIKI